MRAIRRNRPYVVQHLLQLSDQHDWDAIDEEMVKSTPAILRIVKEFWPITWKKRPLDV
jgi:hypothetical protein